MTLTIERESFAGALSAASRIASSKVYQDLRIDAGAGFLHVSATDLEHWLDLSVPCSGELDTVCVHAQRLHDVIASMIGELIGLKIENGSLKIFAGKGKRSLALTPVDQFPMRDFEAISTITVDAEKLREALDFTTPHVAPPHDLAKSYAAGPHFFSEGGKLRLVGGDGFNLAVIDVAEHKGEIGATIPPKAADMASRLPSGPVEISFNERAVEFRWGSGRIVAPLIAAAYPIALICKGFAQELPSSFSVEAKELLAAVRSVRPIGFFDRTSRSTGIHLTLNGSASLSTTAPEGTTEQEFAADWPDDLNFECGFAAVRMDRILSGFGDSVLTIHVAGPTDALRFEAAAKTDRAALLFPMRV